MSNDLVVKANVLVEAGYQLTTNEQRLILSAIACIPKGEPINPNVGYCISKSNFVDLGVNPKTANREIREACDRLFNRYLTIKSEQGEFKTRWVQDITKYNQEWALHNRDLFENVIGENSNEEDCILASVTFSRAVIPFLTELKSNFTQYLLSDVSGFGSAYSFRIYEFMMQYRSTGYIKISLDELRERLQLGEKYPASKDLKVRVIDIAVKEINEKSPYKVGYTLLKTGKKFTHLELRFKKKEATKKNKDDTRDLNTPDLMDGYTDQEREIIAQKQEYAHQKGIIDPAHIQNLINQAIERHRQAVQADKKHQEHDRVKRQTEKARKQAEKQAKDEQERQEKAKAEQRKHAMIAKFESLPHDKQEQILDKVAESVGGAFAKIFNTARRNGTAHKDMMFMGWFFKILDC